MTENDAKIALRDLAVRYVIEPDALHAILVLLERDDLPSLPAKGVLAQIDQVQDRPFSSHDEITVAEIVNSFM